MFRLPSLLVVSLVAAFSAAEAQIASPPEILGAIAGPGSDPVQPDLDFHGTDLGWTVAHKGELQILFGDTNATFDSVCYGQLHNDDSQGTIPTKRPAVGVPPLTIATEPDDPNTFRLSRCSGRASHSRWEMARCRSRHTATAAIWSRSSGAVARFSPVAACRASLADRPSFLNWLTADGLRCSQEVGVCTPSPNDIPTACDLETGAPCNAFLGQVCEPTPTGLCVDPASSQNAASPELPDFQSAADEMEFAVQGRHDREHHESRAALRTNEFINPASRTVKRFTRNRFGNDYRPGDGALLVWGRPGFRAEEGRQAQLHLFTHPLPIPRAHDGRWKFRPWYFAGVSPRTGRPIWSQQQGRAKPLALDGEVGGSPFEEQPLVNQFSVIWVGGSIRKWVMLYGGNLADYLLADPANDRPGAGPGSVRIRFADHPWGPWSPAKPHLLEGAPTEIGSPLPTSSTRTPNPTATVG